MNIPASWKDVLDRLHAGGHPEAFIGGGALRDLDNGKPIKDVDVFLRAAAFHELSNLLPHLLIADCADNREEYEEHFDEVQGIYEGRANDTDPPFNIVVCDGPEDPFLFLMHHLNRFDLGICRIGWDGRLIRYLREYRSDKEARTITVVNPVRPEASRIRAQRIHDRAYQDWTIVLDPFAAIDGMEPEDL